MVKCPKCAYERKPTDEAPDWQCPACSVAYCKVGNSGNDVDRVRRATSRTPVEETPSGSGRKIALLILVILLAGWGATKLGLTDRLRPPSDDARLLEAKQYYVADKSDKALEIYKSLAERGNPKAQFYLASIYEFGWIKERDFGNAEVFLNKDREKAGKWYQRAADQGEPRAQNAIALRLMREREQEPKGAGDEKFNQAVALFQKAAAQDEYHAEYALGRLYYEGKLPSTDISTAETWLTKSAIQGDSAALYLLSALYQIGGAGHQVDVVQAYTLARLASRESMYGFSEPNWTNEHFDSLGAGAAAQGMERTMTPEQIAQAKAAADAWHESSPLPNPHATN